MTATVKTRQQLLVGLGVLLLATGLAVGAWIIPSEAGYAGIGPDFLPWLVSVALLLCGGFLVWESQTGGFRDMDETEDDEPPYWAGFVWMSATRFAPARMWWRRLLSLVRVCLSCT